MPETKTVEMKPMPGVAVLFKDSWQTFTKSIYHLFLFNLAYFGIFIGASLVAGLIAVILVLVSAGKFQAIAANGLQSLSQLPIVTLLLGFVLLLAYLVFTIILSIAFNAGQLLIVDKSGDVKIKEVIKKSLGFVAALVIANLVTSFITMGSMFLLFLPALLIAFFFSFVTQEIVISNKKALDAVRGSVYLVSKRFAPLLGRVILYAMIYLAIVSIIPSILRNLAPDAQAIVSLLSFFVNIFLGWYSLVFSITLYKQAKEGLPAGKTNLLWLTIISVIGWLFGILIIIFVTQFIASEIKKNNGLPKRPLFPTGYQRQLPNPRVSIIQDYNLPDYNTQLQ